MKLSTELGDEYVNTVLSNLSLKDLPDEEWKLIEGFENYAVSNYGRIKSLERCVVNSYGGEHQLLDRIMKLQVTRYYNKYLKSYFYSVRCNLCVEGKTYGKSVARLVYYHFVEKFDMDDHSFLISFKDDNRFNVHFSNLEKLTVSKLHSKSLSTGRGKKGNYQQAVSQYTVDGNFVASYESIYAASETLGIYPPHILSVLDKKNITTGKFLWFEKKYKPTKENFTPERKSKPEKILNTKLWKRLGQPLIDESNPPACMNLSLKDLPRENWKPFPDLEEYFAISNKGRIKRLNTWTQSISQTFWKEQIISLFVQKSGSEKYFLYTKISCNGRSYNIAIIRMLYYCFIEKFDLKDRNRVIINENDPQWDIDISKLTLQSVTNILTERNKAYSAKVRTVLNSKEVFNNSLWEKLDKPRINKKNPPAVFDLNLRDLLDESWRPLPGFEGKYVISNKGRVKRLIGWSSGAEFYEEEQILSLKFKKSDSSYLYFNLRTNEGRFEKRLPRMLYYCFVEEFNLNDRTLWIVNENETLWDVDLSKLSLHSMADALNKRKTKT
jgi:hypothetical protein